MTNERDCGNNPYMCEVLTNLKEVKAALEMLLYSVEHQREISHMEFTMTVENAKRLIAELED